MKKREGGILAWAAAVFLLVGMAAGCSRSEEARYQLNPKQPVMITVWNYYNGQTKQAFDNLVSRFNETVGTEMGIIVDSVSYGDVNQLAEEAYNSAIGRLGADAMPNLFAAYPENAYRIDVLGKLVDLNQYFSEDELKVYRADFLQDCSFGGNYGLKILPVVRSTENLFLNKTDWDRFAGDTGVRLDRLSTWEGVAETAKAYYEWSGGKAFLGIDSLANYIIVASVQTGNDIYKLQDGQVTFSFDQDLARILWDELYVPYVKGYYANLGKFADIATAATASIFPGMFKLVGTLDERLSFAGRRHQRFDDTRETDFGGCFLQFVQCLGIKIVGCFQAEFFGGKVTDRLTVHREVDGTGTGHYLNSFFFKVIETLCADGFYLRNDDVRMMFFYNAFQCFTVQHVEDFKFIGNLHSRCSGIRITSNDVLPLALCRDHKLFS